MSRTTATDATGTHTYAYDPALLTLQNETLPSFFGNGSTARILTEKFDTTGTGTKGRSIGFSLGTTSATTSDYDVTYGYDTYGRAGSVTSGGATFTYGYTPNSNLIGSIADTVSGWTQTRTWGTNLNVLTNLTTMVGTTTKSAFAYGYDVWARRTSVIRSGEIYLRYVNGGLVSTWGYDDRSQVTAAQTFYGTSLSDQSYPVEGRNFGFSFDNIGNRLTSSTDGREPIQTGHGLTIDTADTEGTGWANGAKGTARVCRRLLPWDQSRALLGGTAAGARHQRENQP